MAATIIIAPAATVTEQIAGHVSRMAMTTARPLLFVLLAKRQPATPIRNPPPRVDPRFTDGNEASLAGGSHTFPAIARDKISRRASAICSSCVDGCPTIGMKLANI